MKKKLLTLSLTGLLFLSACMESSIDRQLEKNKRTFCSIDLTMYNLAYTRHQEPELYGLDAEESAAEVEQSLQEAIERCGRLTEKNMIVFFQDKIMESAPIYTRTDFVNDSLTSFPGGLVPYRYNGELKSAGGRTKRFVIYIANDGTYEILFD